MNFSIFRLTISTDSPFVPCLRKLNPTYYPFIYSKTKYRIDGYFFFYGQIESFFLKQFCVDVIRISEDSISSLNLSDSKKYFTNNERFFDDYFYLERYDVTSIFSWLYHD